MPKARVVRLPHTWDHLVVSGVSVERVRKVLLSGARLVGQAVGELPAGSAIRARAEDVRDCLSVLTWCQARDGQGYQLDDEVPTDVRLVLFPNRELKFLGNRCTFQTAPRDDGTLHVNVRAVSLTPLWAGLGLFHELSHIHDFRSGSEPRNPSDEQYLEGEARAYHLEVTLLNALSEGRLAAALAARLTEPLAPEVLAAEPGARLADQLERAAARPGSEAARSSEEEEMRDAAHRIAALLAFHYCQSDPVAVEHPETAARDLGRFFYAAPPMPNL